MNARTGAPAEPVILDRCPRCGGDRLYTVFDGETTNFLCRSCDRCWTIRTGEARQVDPATCPGCEWRPTCLSRWDAGLPPDEEVTSGTHRRGC